MAISWSSRGSKSGVEKKSMGFMVWEGDHKEEFSSYKEDKIGKEISVETQVASIHKQNVEDR